MLLCKGDDGADCLTAPQVEAARKVYGPGRNPRTGKELFGTLAPGSELGWAVMGGGPEPYAPILDQSKYVVFQDPNWDWRTFDFDKDNDALRTARIPHHERHRSAPREVLRARRQAADVSRLGRSERLALQHRPVFPERAGTLWARQDRREYPPLHGARNGALRRRRRPNTFDKIGTLDRWVEEGKAPDSIVASHSTAGKVDRTRPLCPYPQVAQYKGSGSIDDAANFTCTKP